MLINKQFDQGLTKLSRIDFMTLRSLIEHYLSQKVHKNSDNQPKQAILKKTITTSVYELKSTTILKEESQNTTCSRVT